MIKYPVRFYASAEAQSGIQSTWNIESQQVKSLCAIPTEFEGPGGALSPEDLFAQALTNCFIATFKVYAEKSKISFSELSVKTDLAVDVDESKKPVMKNCLLHVSISGCENPTRVKMIADRAFQNGFILNSVKTEIKMELHVRE